MSDIQAHSRQMKTVWGDGGGHAPECTKVKAGLNPHRLHLGTFMEEHA